MDTQVSVALAVTIIAKDEAGKVTLQTQKNVSFTGSPAAAYEAAAVELAKWKLEAAA